MSNSSSPLILNVDDHEAARYARGRILRQAGYETLDAATGSEALRLAQERQPAVMLLDVHLPDISGIEVCRHIKTNPATASIMVMHTSATFTSAQDAVRGLEGGADAYLPEPANPDVLLANVNALVRISQASRLAQHIKLISDRASDAHFLLDRSGRIRYVNQTSCERLGYAEWELLQMNAADITLGFEAEAYQRLFDRAQIDRVPLQELTRIRKDGTSIPVEASITGTSLDGEPYLFMAARDITERKRSEESFRFLVDSSAALGLSLDYQETLQRVASMAVPTMADWCVVHVTQPNGNLEAVVFAHAHAQKESLLADALLRYPEVLQSLLGVSRVAAGGVSELMPEVALQRVTLPGDVQGTRLLRQLQMRAYMTVPLSARGLLFGVISFVRGESGQRYDAKDLQLAELLTLRAALAVDNARLYRESRLLSERLEERVAERTSELRSLANHLQSAREEERLELSRELHDEAGQKLAALRIMLAQMLKHLNDGQALAETTGELAEGVHLVDETIQTMRGVVTRLRPSILDDLGLVAAIEWLADDFCQRTQIDCQFSTNVEKIQLDDQHTLALFRIVQEALTNVARHAHATHVDIRLDVDEASLVLSIQDNGRGLSPDAGSRPGSHGILGMRERALLLHAQFTVESAPGTGTTVRLHMPV